MSEGAISLVLSRLYPMFNIKSGSREDTVIFQKISHEELCDAIQYWLEHNRLLLVEPINVFITQSLRDEGVDIILECLNTGVKLGFQMKSFNDINASNFASKIKAQIASSKKHGINKLFICFGGDLTYGNHTEKMNGISSEIDEINKSDDYIYVISPLKMLNIYDAYKNKKHPLRYLVNFATVRDAVNAILEALSDHPHYVPKIKLEFILKEELKTDTRPVKLRLSLKDGAFEGGLTLLDKLEEAHLSGESFRIPGEMIHEFVVNGEKIKFDPDKGFIEIKPELLELPPCEVFIEDDNGVRTKYFENIVFVRDKIIDGVVHLRTKGADVPIDFLLSIDPKASKASFGINYDVFGSSVKEALNFFRFQNRLFNKEILVLVNEKGEMGGQVSIPEHELIDNAWIELYEKVNYIQDTIGHPIQLDKPPDRELLQDIIILFELLSDGETKRLSIKPEFTMRKSQIIQLLEYQKRVSFIKDLKCEIKDFGIDFLGYQIILGNVVYEIDKMRFMENVESLERKLEGMGDEDTLDVSLEKHEDSIQRLFITTRNLVVTITETPE